jgi:hypothetical protein
VLPFAKAETLLPMLILTQRIKEAFDQACANLGEEFTYEDDLDDNYNTVRFPHPMPSSECVLTCAPAQKLHAQCAWPSSCLGGVIGNQQLGVRDGIEHCTRSNLHAPVCKLGS